MDSVTATGAVIPAGRSAPAPAAPRPLGWIDGAPLYRAGQAPDHLRSQTQLAGDRLKPASGQRPVAWVRTREWGDVALYEPAAAERMRPLPSSVKRKMAARRTCPTCLTVRPDIVRGRRCTACAKRERVAERRRAARTCRDCATVRERPYPAAHGRCRVCRTAQLARERERRAAWLARVTVCAGEDCAVGVVAKRTALAWVRSTGGAWYVPSEWPRRCRPCQAAHEEREAARREAWETAAAERAAREREEWQAAMAAQDGEALGAAATGAREV